MSTIQIVPVNIPEIMNTIKEYCPKWLAEKLKAAGYNYPTISFYVPRDNTPIFRRGEPIAQNWNSVPNRTSAPLLHIAEHWLMVEKNILIKIRHGTTPDTNGYNYFVRYTSDAINKHGYKESKKWYDSYEKAQAAAINAALELISENK